MKYIIIVALLVSCFVNTNAQQVAEYNYDNLNRLTEVIYQGSPSNTVINYTYDELGNRLTKSVSGFSLQLSVSAFLQGPFYGSEMNTSLNDRGVVPLSQPYGGSPWNYAGTESVAYIPANAVDWVLVELRDATNAASADGSTLVTSQAAFLTKDGKVVGVDGSSNLIFDETINQDLFVVIWHRNHLGVMSAVPLTESNGVYTYDFTNAADKAYGTNPQKELGPGIWGMMASDGDASGQVNLSDINSVWDPQAGESGYKPGDFDMDGQVSNPDKDDVWVINEGKGTQVPD